MASRLQKCKSVALKKSEVRANGDNVGGLTLSESPSNHDYGSTRTMLSRIKFPHSAAGNLIRRVHENQLMDETPAPLVISPLSSDGLSPGLHEGRDAHGRETLPRL